MCFMQVGLEKEYEDNDAHCHDCNIAHVAVICDVWL